MTLFKYRLRETSIQTIHLVHSIRALMHPHKETLRDALPKMYRQDLLNHLFCHPYTKITALESALNVSRITAARCLNELDRVGLMQKLKLGRNNYYVNITLVALLGKATTD